MKIVKPDKGQHHKELRNLLSMFTQSISNRIDDTHFDWETSRIGIVDGKIVTFWPVFDITMRIGTGRVRVAGINCVFTHPEYRKRGLMTQTAWASIEAMRENGYDLSLLHGSTAYYRRFGYTRAWPDSSHIIKTDSLPSEGLYAHHHGRNIQEFTPFYSDELAALYNHENATITGTAVRPTFRVFKLPGYFLGFMWTNDQGDALGYIIIEGPDPGADEPPKITLIDSAGDPEEILRMLGYFARGGKCDNVVFTWLPNRSLLSQQLRRLGCEIREGYGEDGGWMVSVINLRTVVDKLTSELATRLSQSHLSQWCGKLLVSNKAEEAVLSINKSSVCLVPLCEAEYELRGGNEIVQLLIGSKSLDELAGESILSVSEDTRQLARALFPKQHPQMSRADL